MPTTGWNANQNQMKNMHPFYILFQVLKVPFVKKFKIQLPDLLFLVVLHQQISFLELHTTLLEEEKKICVMKIYLLFYSLLFYKVEGSCHANQVKQKAQLQVFFNDFYHRTIAVQCITDFCRTPLFTEHFSLSAFFCECILILCVLIMPRMRFRVNPHSIVA